MSGEKRWAFLDMSNPLTLHKYVYLALLIHG
jgi:hypothetical protein